MTESTERISEGTELRSFAALVIMAAWLHGRVNGGLGMPEGIPALAKSAVDAADALMEALKK